MPFRSGKKENVRFLKDSVTVLCNDMRQMPENLSQKNGIPGNIISGAVWKLHNQHYVQPEKMQKCSTGLTWQLVFTMWLGSASCSTGAKDQVFSHLNCNLVVILTRKPAFQHRVTEVEVTELYGELHWSICLRCNGHESLQFCVRETVYTLLCYLTDECFEIYPPPLKFPKIIF